MIPFVTRSSIRTCIVVNQGMSTKDFAEVMVIDIPRKIWRPKINSKLKPSLFCKGIKDVFFLFESFDQAILRPAPWEPGLRTDVIFYDEGYHTNEYDVFKINTKSVVTLLPTLKSILRSYWDFFVATGIWRVILGYKFAIGTGNATLMCCKKPHYWTHEFKIIDEHIQVLLLMTGSRNAKMVGDLPLFLRQRLAKNQLVVLMSLSGECACLIGN